MKNERESTSGDEGVVDAAHHSEEMIQGVAFLRTFGNVTMNECHYVVMTRCFHHFHVCNICIIEI